MTNPNLPAIRWDGFNKLPDKGVVAYVCEILAEIGIDVDSLPAHWIPIGVVGTLDWITVVGWWLMDNTSFFLSDEPKNYIFSFDDYEFDADKLLVFREDAQCSKFPERFRDIRIYGRELSEGVPFLLHDVYGGWARREGADPDAYIPPQEFVEYLMWATFLWVMSDQGRDWIYMQDEVLACVIEYGVAYLELWSGDRDLLDPKLVHKVRPRQSCAYCGEQLWCTQGTSVDSAWRFVCAHCHNELKNSDHFVEGDDDRIIKPPCPHLADEDGTPGTCTMPCKHSGRTREDMMERIREHGSERLQEYREYVHAMGGMSPRMLSGQTADDIIDYFK